MASARNSNIYTVTVDGLLCHVRIDARARRIIVRVVPDGLVVVTIPHQRHSALVAPIVQKRRVWIDHARARFQSTGVHTYLPGSAAEYRRHTDTAYRIALERLTHFNAFYQTSWNGVRIKNQTSRWGSCSRTGMLYFNYRIALIPPALADYIIVHELCHLLVFDHSVRFWQLVSKAIPDYKEQRKALRAYAVGR
jgi:predicted metal-dependent hydrolase